MGFKVIIVGGSISGLSLANMLEKFDIEYVLLEGHSVIAPQLGASLGLLPSGLRILDQLGCYEKIKELAGNTYYSASMRLFSGETWVDKEPVTFSEKLEDRIGYPQMFIDRRTVIQVLYDNLKFKNRVMTDKRVTRVDHHEDHVAVHTKDGSVYTGDIVIGGDGVHSAVRKEMWRLASEASPGLFKDDELSGLQSVCKCIFGISKRPKAVPTGPLQINAFFKNCNYMVLTAPEERLYWFLFTEMDKASGKDIPRFTKEDERKLAEEHFGDQISETMTFEDLYNHGQQTTLVSVEDHVFPRWHYRRILTVGDAAHKVHPISAQGGNGAMETSAVLVNALRRKLKETSCNAKLTESDISAIFAEAQEARFGRAMAAVNQGRHTNDASIKETFFSKIFVDYFFPRYGQWMIFSLIVKNTAGAPTIDDIPVPTRYLEAVARYERNNPSTSTGWKVWSFVSIGVALITGFFYTKFSAVFPQLLTIKSQ
ncbi:hypothetical protein D7B24_007388 [Verticillium nonalfalfae]|uniref:FAD-binding domain-containing protein n=1 Tax=Verticillium nonalfalfae TaxID=1051616 RepID=A0A3M9Y754_9PEZI|nr:uncharacterized protein D7B24_007388 [Verticillium nonalfalfae]RNJ56333.1 hypothetical protein D7B24_007388 [Verticillium nonalfalfae]